MKTIAKFFPDAKHVDYGDPAANQARAENPMLTLAPNVATVAALRRTRFKLTPAGQKAIAQIKAKLIRDYYPDLAPELIKVSYNQHCGCECPCSPGFDLKAEVSPVMIEKGKSRYYEVQTGTSRFGNPRYQVRRHPLGDMVPHY